MTAAKAQLAKSTRLEAERIMAERRQQKDADEQEEIKQLSVVVVDIESVEAAEAIGLAVDSRSGGVVVKTVDKKCKKVALVVLKG